MPQFIAPFPRKGVVLKAPEDRSVSSLLKFPVFLRALPSSIPVGQTKRRPFYGQAKGQLRLTWKPSAGSPQSEGSRFKTIVNQLSLNTGRQEGAVAGGSPPLWCLTAPPSPTDGKTIERTQQCKKPYINRFPIDIRLLFMEPATGFEPATYALRMRRSTS